MKRFHVHISVDDMDGSIRFYSTMFGTPPTVRKSDYAKWMLDDPRVNFALSQRGAKPGVDHLGIKVDLACELEALRQQVAAANIARRDQTNAECCYARSDKYWTTDPQGVAWETFHTLEAIPVYGKTERTDGSSCCAPGTAVNGRSGKSAACCA